MENCLKIYVGKPNRNSLDGVSHTIEYDSNEIKIMEDCCRSNFQCDVQKRMELNNTSIDENLRHCECENKFRECLDKTNIYMISLWTEYYFMHTPKCYSIDHPKTECEQTACYYHPSAPKNQYSRRKNGAIRCVKYDLDKIKPKIYQTFELPFYYVAYEPYELKWFERQADICEDSVY